LLSRESSSQSSTPSSETKHHGKPLDLQDSRSPIPDIGDEAHGELRIDRQHLFRIDAVLPNL
jgi:hypothetical protein